MSPTRPALLAFAGPAVVAEDTINDLLVDYIGDGGKESHGYQNFTREVTAILPVAAPLWTKGVGAVATWMEATDVPFTALVTETRPRGAAVKHVVDIAGDVATCTDVAEEMITRLVDAKDSHEVTLVLAWGEEGDAACEALLDAALDAGITVRDLSAGLDDISFDDDSEESEPDPEPEPAPRPARAKAASAPDLEEVVEDLVEPEPEPRAEKQATLSLPMGARDTVKNSPAMKSVLDAVALRTDFMDLSKFSTNLWPALGNLPEVADIAAKFTIEPNFPDLWQSIGRTAPMISLLDSIGPVIAATAKGAPQTSVPQPQPAAQPAPSDPFAAVRTAVEAAHGAIVEHLPASRERSLAITNLDQALLWVQGALGAPLSHGQAPEAPEPIEPAPAAQQAAQGVEHEERPPSAPARTPAPAGEAVAYIRSPEGRYRKAGRGRPRTNHERVMLSPIEVTNAAIEGLIDVD